ncbi:MAG TPA: pyridoxine 5'-phosphate synthase [Polyangiaceae bacterium]
MRLHVNVDHVATVRNARGTPYPDPVLAARACLEAGCNGITAHLREDRRHIVDDDMTRLRELVTLPQILNMECAATDEMIGIALALGPDCVTLVPERREERTTEGGLDVIGGGAKLADRVRKLRDGKLRVSLFIAPDAAQIRASHALHVEQVELHTGEYAHACSSSGGGAKENEELARLAEGARVAHALGMEVAAGHGLTRDNVGALVRIREIVELNIGHAMIADAIFLSMSGSVRAMLSVIGEIPRTLDT